MVLDCLYTFSLYCKNKLTHFFYSKIFIFLFVFVLKSIAIFSLIEYEPVKYKTYTFPKWAEYTGWCIALSSILAIPIYAIILLARQTGSLKEVCRMK